VLERKLERQDSATEAEVNRRSEPRRRQRADVGSWPRSRPGTTALARLRRCTTGGAVKCWGWNANGDLGDGTTTARLTPVSRGGAQRRSRSQYRSARPTTARLLAGGAVKCWGWNAYGQLGERHDGGSLHSGQRCRSAGSRHRSDRGCLAAAAAVLATGGAVCWGSNSAGPTRRRDDNGPIGHRLRSPVLPARRERVNRMCVHLRRLGASGQAKCWAA